MDSTSPRARIGRAVVALLLASHPWAHAPHDVITELALSPAFATDRTVFATVTLTDNNIFVRSTDAGRSWTYIGTPMASTAPDVFAFSPEFAVDGTAFAANSASGMWRTQDAGLTWQPAGAGIPTLLVKGVAVSPNFGVDRRVLAATGQGNFLSLDGGNTWTPASTGLAEPAQRRVAFARGVNGTLVAFSVGTVIHRSLDGGRHWAALGAFDKPAEALAVSPDFAHDQRVAVSFGRFGLGVAHSSNAGTSFQFKNNGLPDLFVEELCIAQDGAMFAATDTAGCFRTDTPDGPWQLIVDGFEPASDLTLVHNTEIVASPAFATDDTVFAGAYEGMYRSADRGDSWRQLNVYSQLLNRCFVLTPDYASDSQILAGNYGGGVFHYTEQTAARIPPADLPGAGGALRGGGSLGGVHSGEVAAGGPAAQPELPFAWDVRSTDLTAPWSAVLAASPGPPGARTLGYGYTKLRKSTDEGLHWASANEPSTVSVVRALAFSPAFAQDGMVFLGSGMTGSFRSEDSCASWSSLQGLPATLSASAICISPAFAADGTLYYASRNFGIWRSQTSGDSFAQVNLGLPTTNIKSLALSPDFVADRMLLAGTNDDGVWASLDAGHTWLEDNSGLPAGPRMVESIAFSPGFAGDRTVFIALQDQGVWRSTNGALSWQATGAGLRGPPVKLAVSSSFPQDRTVFAGTLGGTCVSRDAGATWQPLPGYVRADDFHPALKYEGDWDTIGGAEQCCGTLTVTGTAGASTELEFLGSHVAWFAQRVPEGAIASVQIDDEPPVLVDTWQATADELATRIYSRRFDAPGWHVIRVVHTGTANPSSTGFTLRSDGFEYSE